MAKFMLYKEIPVIPAREERWVFHYTGLNYRAGFIKNPDLSRIIMLLLGEKIFKISGKLETISETEITGNYHRIPATQQELEEFIRRYNEAVNKK